MKILFFSNLPTPYQLDFAKAMNQLADYRCYFLYNTEANRDWILDIPEYCHIASYTPSIKAYRDFYHFFRSYNPDVVFMSGYTLPLSNYVIFLAKLFRKKIYMQCEKPFPSSGLKKFAKYLYLKVKLSFTDGIFAIGKDAVEAYKPFQKNIYNMPYSADLTNFLAIERLNKIPESVKFLFVGQFIERKGVNELLHALEQIEEYFELTFVGSGEMEPLIKEALLSDQRIKLSGFVQPKNLPKLYSKHDVFILPSKHDGWALVVPDAMAAGMPVIGTNATGAVYEYIDEEQGKIISSDPDSIVKAMQYYINHPEIIYSQSLCVRNTIITSLSNSKLSAEHFIFLSKKSAHT